MALGGNALGNGWHDQAARLAGAHTVTKRTHPAAADDSAEPDLAQALEQASARAAALEHRLAQETATTQALREHLALLDHQFDIAEERADDMEIELAAALDRAAEHDAQAESLQAENQSLQASLDLALAENARLSQHLQQNDAVVDDARAELTLVQTASATAAAERGKLAGEVLEANSKRLRETTELKAELEAMAGRAVTAEKLLADAREHLLARITETGEAERNLAEAVAARRDTDMLLKQLQDLLCVKQCQVNELEQARRDANARLDQLQNSLGGEQRHVNELEQSRTELIAATQALVKTCQNREAALAKAGHKIETLSARIARLEAEAAETRRRNAPARQAQPRQPAVNRAVVRSAGLESADRRTAVNWTALASEFVKLVQLKGQSAAEPLPAQATSALLAGTITF